MSRIDVEITEEAHNYVKDYLKEQEDIANIAQGKDSDAPSLGMYIRIEEMLLRLMCNAVSYNHAQGTAIVDKQLAQACIEFHRFQTGRFFKNELAEISKGSGERDLDVVMKGLKKAYMDNGQKAVKAGQVATAIKSTKRPKNLSYVLQELVKRGQVILQMLPNVKTPGHNIAHYLPVKEDDIDGL